MTTLLRNFSVNIFQTVIEVVYKFPLPKNRQHSIILSACDDILRSELFGSEIEDADVCRSVGRCGGQWRPGYTRTAAKRSTPLYINVVLGVKPPRN